MRDEDFEYFISKFGEANSRIEAPASAIQTWQGKLPDHLLMYWRDEGWCNYANGLFWTVDPDEYEVLVDEWLDGSPLEQIDSFHVIARSAFGDLYLCGERSGRSATLCCAPNAISAVTNELKPKTPADRDSSIRSFFCFSRRDRFDLQDDVGTPLFDRTLTKLGPLAADEMYGFEPALVAGGKMRLENLHKVKLDQHLTILRQMAAPTMPFSNVDIEKLLRSS
jgi:hypothetical protein